MRRATKPSVTLVVTLAVTLSLVGVACNRKDDPPQPHDVEFEPARQQIPAGTADDIPELDHRGYARSLVEQLDLVPPDADGYLVIRDLRPMIEQARRVEQVMAGPLARAIPALAKLGGGTGEARLAQLERAHDTLELLLAGLEASGLALDRGLVVALGGRAPVVVFVADDLAKLALLAGLLGEGVALSDRCGALPDRPGHFACSLGDPQALRSYVPAGQGQALAKRLADRLGADELTTLDAVNLALSLAGDDSIDIALRTDPGLWELSMPMPKAATAGEQLFSTGSAPALRAMVPGSSFAWARLDAAALSEGAPEAGPLSAKMLTGELWFGAVDEPAGLVAQLGHHDASTAATTVQTLAALLPDDEIAPEQLGGLRLELDRASIQLGGEKIPSLGLTAVGEDAQAWAASLGVEPRARLWANRDYLSLALGEVQAIPGALDRLEGSGPSKRSISSLPPTLAQALVDGEVGLLLHVVLDHWQAPPSEAELQALLRGLPEDTRPSPLAITSAFQALAPWSSVDVWLSRKRPASPWLLHVSLVPFAGEVAGVEQLEQQAATAVLDAVLAGGDGATGYRELATQFPRSPRASSYRARVGDAPEHHAAASMVLIGAIGAVAVPALQSYLGRAKSSEAPAQTQAIASAALAVIEREGCNALIGEAGPTPPLSVVCSEGEGGRCRIGVPGYPTTAWSEDRIWKQLGVDLSDRALRFHYQFSAKAKAGGCELHTLAFGDLDGDGVYSTYERAATVAADGSKQLEPMRIVDPDE